MSYIIGVDPGKTGAIALLSPSGKLVRVADMPATGKFVSAGLLADIFDDCVLVAGGGSRLAEVICVIEDVSSSSQMGVTSAFSFGRSKGVVEGVAAGFGMRLVYVTPAKWKRDMKLDADKEKSRKMAIDRWPDLSDQFKFKLHADRAEAGLLALWQLTFGS